MRYLGEVNFNHDEYVGYVEVVTLTPSRNWTKPLNNSSDQGDPTNPRTIRTGKAIKARKAP